MRFRFLLLLIILVAAGACQRSNSTPAAADTRPAATDSAAPAPTRDVEASPMETDVPASPTIEPVVSPTAGSENGSEAGASITPTAAPDETPTLTPPAIDLAQLVIEGEMVVDGPNGKLYLRAIYRDEPYTAAFDADEGRLLALYPETGRFTADPIRRWLIVDRGNAGIAIRDVVEDTIVQEIILPGTVPQGGRPAAPAVMETSGDILAFRNSTVYRVDPISGMIEHLVTFEEPLDVCGQPGDPAPISAGWWDEQQQILYLSFLTYACTPWTGFTLRSYDVAAGEILAEEPGLPPFAAVATDQGLVLRAFPRLGPAYFQRWQADGGGIVGDEERHYGAGPLAYDAQRSGVYVLSGREMQLVDGMSLAVRSRATRARLGLAAGDRLLGYDSVSDQLYIREESGRLRPLDGAVVRAALEEAVAPPAGAVLPGSLHAHAGEDGVMVSGAWSDPECDAPGVVFLGQSVAGPWRNRAINGTGDVCDGVSALAQSIVGGTQPYLFALQDGSPTVFASFDGGVTWGPFNTAAPATLDQLLSSPAYGQDLTLFAWSAANQTLYRTESGGDAWQAVRNGTGPAALSYEFGADRTVATFQDGTVYLSGDGGDTWRATAPLPDGEQVSAVSLAPLWDRWGVLFAYTESGALYRSLDRGASWAFMLRAGGDGAQFAYGSDEARREVLLLAEDGLYRSGDGGATWTYVGYPEATALAISPDFAADRTLFLGTEFGDIVAVDTASP